MLISFRYGADAIRRLFRVEPKRQGAALAVLSYFFDNCDIFEDPISANDAELKLGEQVTKECEAMATRNLARATAIAGHDHAIPLELLSVQSL